jgi:hypothetical protein
MFTIIIAGGVLIVWGLVGFAVLYENQQTLLYNSNTKQLAFILIVSGPIVWITAVLVFVSTVIETGLVKIYKMLK